MANYGFIDARTSAELLLSPAAPLKRISLDTGSLRLDIGGLTGIPGAISGASQITGSIRGAFSAAAITRQVTQSFAGALNASFTAITNTAVIQASVDPMFLRNTGVSISTANLTVDASLSGISVGATLPGPMQYVQFSALRPGQVPGLAQAAALNDRKNQIQGIASRFSSLGSAPIGSGVQVLENMNRIPYPLTNELNVPSFARLSVGGSVAQADNIFKDKTKFVVRGVRVASGKPGFWSRLKTAVQSSIQPGLNVNLGQVFRDATNNGGWSEPAPPYAAQYPYNKATQTESGHIFELDDTPGAERIHIFHRSGSFIEFHPNGTVVYKSMKDNYQLTMKDQNVKVAGKCNIYVGGDTTLFSKGDVNVETEGEFNVQCKKDFNVFAKNINLRAKRVFKADGVLINLRYVNLPYQITPTFGGLVPLVNLAAMRLDFPTGTFDSVVRESLKNPLDPGTLPSLLKFQTDAEALTGALEPPQLPSNPLSNPAAYEVKTAAAAAYRARMFDTPEETENFELYSAHLGLQESVDGASGEARALGGKLTGVTERDINVNPAIDYLDFNTYAGNFVYTESHQLGNTSFKMSDLVDTVHANDVVTAKKTPLQAATEVGQDAGLAGPLTANNTDLTIQGALGSGGVNGGRASQPIGTAYEVPGEVIPATGLAPWQY